LGTLYLVATPIGNLEDVTLRALRVLRQVDLIAAEDTRTARKLLSHYDIHRPLVSYNDRNKRQRTPVLLEALSQGDVALVSEAGTPAISDTGQDLVAAAWEAGHRVVPVPGPSALTAALAASGLRTRRFLYLGFLPRQPGALRRQRTRNGALCGERLRQRRAPWHGVQLSANAALPPAMAKSRSGLSATICSTDEAFNLSR